MDTRFWGPDGWKLFHCIAVTYPVKPTKKDRLLYKQFFVSIEHILPCIYCRQSFHQYAEELPINDYLDSRTSLSYWLYLMHNKVNKKLFGQGLYVDLNDDFKAIHQKYIDLVKEINSNHCYHPLPGWDLLYCILFNYPLQKKPIEPIRFKYYIIFFQTLAQLTPFQTFRSLLSDYLKSYPISDYMNRSSLKLWGYHLEQEYCQSATLRCPKFRDRCYSIELFRAGCNGKNDPKPTCHI